MNSTEKKLAMNSEPSLQKWAFNPRKAIEQTSIEAIIEGNYENKSKIQITVINRQLELRNYGDVSGKINKYENQDYLLKKIAVIIALFNDSIKVTTDKMNGIEIYECAKWFCVTYTHERADDFILCLRQAKEGKFGKIYNRIDSATIMSWFVEYLTQKAIWVEGQYQQEKSNRYDSRTEAEAAIREQKNFIEEKNATISSLFEENTKLKQIIKNHE